MKYSSNISQGIVKLTKKLEALITTDQLTRAIASNQLSRMKTRIHEQGLDANDEPIGTYSVGYMKLRTGNYQNSEKFKKGKKKGENKNAGKFTKGQNIKLDLKTGVFDVDEKIGTARPNYNRTSDTKVIASLTRLTENSTTIIGIAKGYAIGTLNAEATNRRGYVEETYNKKIWATSKKERPQLKQDGIDYINEILSA